MILGIGSDIVDISRISGLYVKYGHRFTQRVFTARELEVAEGFADESRRYSYLAKRFAAKEACAKALGTGVGSQCAFSDICILNTPTGKPSIALSGHAAETFNALIPKGKNGFIHISLSDSLSLAQAFVVLSAD